MSRVVHTPSLLSRAPTFCVNDHPKSASAEKVAFGHRTLQAGRVMSSLNLVRLLQWLV